MFGRTKIDAAFGPALEEHCEELRRECNEYVVNHRSRMQEYRNGWLTRGDRRNFFPGGEFPNLRFNRDGRAFSLRVAYDPALDKWIVGGKNEWEPAAWFKGSDVDSLAPIPSK